MGRGHHYHHGKNITINQNLEEVDFNPHGWLWGFKTLVEEVPADLVKTTTKLKWKLEPEDVTELLQFHDIIWMDEDLLFMDEQRKWFLGMEPTPDKDAVKPWLVWHSGLRAGLRTNGSLVQFPVRAHVWVVGQVPPVGAMWEATIHWYFSPSLAPSLPLSLKINK